jgi:hypothetical protein
MRLTETAIGYCAMWLTPFAVTTLRAAGIGTASLAQAIFSVTWYPTCAYRPKQTSEHVRRSVRPLSAAVEVPRIAEFDERGRHEKQRFPPARG